MDATGAALVIGSIATLAHESKPLIETGAKLIDSLLGEPFKIAGGMLGDEMYLWRIGRLLGAVGKTKQRLDAAGISPRALPPGFLIPLLESASVSQSEEIHDLFAKILASAVSNDIYQHPIFRHAASQMTADELRIITRLRTKPEKPIKLYSVGGFHEPIFKGAYPDTSDPQISDSTRFMMSVENLQRLSLIQVVRIDHAPPAHVVEQPNYKKRVEELHDDIQIRHVQSDISLTHTGRTLGDIIVDLAE